MPLSDLANFASMLDPLPVNNQTLSSNVLETKNAKRNSTKRKHDSSKGVTATSCSNCFTTNTPLWRRGGDGEPLCNACGLFYKSRKRNRPIPQRKIIKKAPSPISHGHGTCAGDGHCNGTGGSSACSGCPAYNQRLRPDHICSNCNATNTPLWRRDEKGFIICNACGLYYKMHGYHRPSSMKRATIKRRKRITNICEHDEDSESICQSTVGVTPKSSTPHPKVGTIVRRSSTPLARSRPGNSPSIVDKVPAIEDCFTPSVKSKDSNELPKLMLDFSDEPLVTSDQPRSPRLYSNESSYSARTPQTFNHASKLSSQMCHIINPSPVLPPIHEVGVSAPFKLPPISNFYDGLPQSKTSMGRDELLQHREKLRREMHNIQALLSNTSKLLSSLDNIIEHN